MKKINFEDGTPLFTEQELCDAVSCVARIISTAVRQQDFDPSNWEDYLNHWVKQTHQSEEVHKHISEVAISSLRYMQGHE
jgi:hypothetical protein